MKQQFIKASMLAALTLLAVACSKEQDSTKNNNSQPVEGIVFSMSEAPYNDDVDVATRANASKVVKDTFDLGGVDAEVMLERDFNQPKQATRAITSGNHYTIVAFKAGTAQSVAEIKGYFDPSGTFKYDSGSELIKIPSGNYDFVCYTHQYATRSGNTVSISLDNADKAFVCRQTNVAIANVKRQEVAFTMKHVGARVRTKLVAVMQPTGVTGTVGYQANNIPASTDYDLITGTFSASSTKSPAAKMETQRYNIQGTVQDAALQIPFTTLTGNRYLTVLAGTKPEELVYEITGGTVYNATLNTNGTRKLKATGAFEGNGVYTLTIKLMPRYIYLFEDGITGPLNATNRQGHVPIAIVFSSGRAIALWDANGGQNTRWATNSDYQHQRNSTRFDLFADAVSNATSGKVWTWENYGGMIKADETQFPAYHYAANFYTSPDLTNKLGGKNLDATINKREAWYLPSVNEWKEVFVKLAFGDESTISQWSGWSWVGGMLHYAFVAANGASITDNNTLLYWSSTEQQLHNAYFVYMDRQSISVDTSSKYHSQFRVRPFVAF